MSLVATRIRHTALPDGVYFRSGSVTSRPAGCTRLQDRKGCCSGRASDSGVLLVLLFV